MMFSDTKKKGMQNEPDYSVKDPKAREINMELGRLKERCRSDGLEPEATLDLLISHAAEKLTEAPEVAKTHRFSWISGQIEMKLTPDKE